MRNGQNKRMRNRNNSSNRKGQNPMTRVYESNGPEVKIRGTASHVAEKYLQLARDAQGSGDPVAAEGFYQHAEHYFRIIAAAQEQFRQNQPSFNRNEGGSETRDDSGDDADDEFQPYPNEPFSPQPAFQPQQPPYPQRNEGSYQQHNRPQHQPQHQPQPPMPDHGGDIDRLPSFITGGQQPQPDVNGGNGNGYTHQDNRGDRGDRNDRFNHRRRRRHHSGPRNDGPRDAPAGGGDFSPDSNPGNE